MGFNKGKMAVTDPIYINNEYICREITQIAYGIN